MLLGTHAATSYGCVDLSYLVELVDNGALHPTPASRQLLWDLLMNLPGKPFLRSIAYPSIRGCRVAASDVTLLQGLANRSERPKTCEYAVFVVNRMSTERRRLLHPQRPRTKSLRRPQEVRGRTEHLGHGRQRFDSRIVVTL